jgi:two-component system cell cycle sensor histidine kinase/response regulator CckA
MFGPAGTRPAVLVADDEVTVRHLLEVVLHLQGFNAWFAADGREALDIYERHGQAIDVVLLDVCMPELDGPHTLDGLRRMNPDVLCCFMTGDAGGYSTDDLLQRGAVHIFTKPFLPADFVAVLRKLLVNKAPADYRTPRPFDWSPERQHQSL